MKFRTKVVVCMICIISIVYGVGSAALMSVSFKNSLDREKQSANQSYKMILGMLQVANNFEKLTSKNDVLEIIETLENKNLGSWDSLRLYSKDKIVYEDGEICDKFVKTDVSMDAKHYELSYLKYNNQRYIQTSGMFDMNKEKVYLDVGYNITHIYDQRIEEQKTYYYIFIIMLAVCGILSYAVAVVLTRSLSKLSRASKAIAGGNLSSRANIKSNDEIGNLAKEFDNMADNIQDNINQMEEDMDRQNQFVGNFTHELKTPMTSIIGYADLIRSKTLSESDEMEAASYIVSEAKRLERLSLKLLDIFVINNGDIQLINTSPANIIETVVENLRNSFKDKGIKLSFSGEKGNCLMEPDLIRSMVINLMDNSRKAMDAGGHIDISVKMTNQGCQIQVSDDGKGMPKEALKHITEAFYRVDKSRSRKMGGAGLGLALCAAIVEIHNGDIRFESEEGKGTMVMVEIKGGRQ